MNRLVKLLDKNFLLLLFVFSLALTFGAYVTRATVYPIKSDGIGYYAYLPTFFVHKDVTMKDVVDERYPEGNMPEGWGGINQWNEDTYLDKYPMGVAIMLLPFFIIGHFLTIICSFPTNGWSHIYQILAGIGGITYMVLGVYFLRRFFLQYYSKRIVYLILLSLIFGTHVFHYGTYDNTFSHIFSFFLFSALLYYIPRFYNNFNLKYSLIIAALSGLIVLVRPTNAVFLVFIPLFDVLSFVQLITRVKLYLQNYKKVLLMAFIVILILFPQLLYWKLVTGNWILFSYGEEEYFDFRHPEISNVLFSVRKGIFFWCPILLLALPGFYFMKEKFKAFIIPTIIYLILHTYVVASWWAWFYGGGYSHRAFAESIVAFSLPLAAFLVWSYKKYFKLTHIVVLLFITLQMIQMFQYWLGVIPADGTTFAMYKEIFLRFPRSLFRPEFKLITLKDLKEFK
jgi:hypothetical protein